MTRTQNVALITGASRGLALARELARAGWALIVDARDATALEAARAELAQNTQVLAIAGDMADPAHREALAGIEHLEVAVWRGLARGLPMARVRRSASGIAVIVPNSCRVH